MDDVSGRWIGALSREQLQHLRDDESFHGLLALARVVNSLRFMHQSFLDSQVDDSPKNIRQRINSFLYSGALLFEGIGLSKRIGKHLRHLEAYAGFTTMHRNSEVERLYSQELKRLRNEAIFHFDISAIASGLSEVEGDSVVFVSGDGTKQGHTYYELADLTVLRHLFGSHESDVAFEEHSRLLIQRVTDLSVDFLRASDRLISSALHSFGVFAEPLDTP
jgi:hypothetical protein